MDERASGAPHPGAPHPGAPHPGDPAETRAGEESGRLPVQRVGDSITTGSIEVVTEDVSSDDSPGPWVALLRVVLVLSVSALVGAIAAPVWLRLTPLAQFTINSTYAARTTETGWNAVFASDFLAAVVGIVAGLVVGVLALVIGRCLGWWVTLLATTGAIIAFVAMGWIGLLLGPADDVHEIARAAPGQTVVSSLRLHTATPVGVWVIAALTPVVVWALTAPDPDRVHRVRLRNGREARPPRR